MRHTQPNKKAKDALDYAMDHADELQQEFHQLPRRLSEVVGSALGEVFDAAVDAAVAHAKDWVWRRLHGGIPQVPFKLPRM